MPQIKLNHLVNLHDARYCASQNVHFMSYDIGRGLDRRLPPKTALEIIKWLEGPTHVLNFGNDLEGHAAFLSEHTLPGNLLFQFDPNTTPDPAETGPERLLRHFSFASPDELANLAPDIDAAADTVAWVELEPLAAHEAMVELLDGFLLAHTNLILNVDAFGLEVIDRFEIPPNVIAMRKLVEEDFLNLSFDKFEALYDQLGIDQFELGE